MSEVTLLLIPVITTILSTIMKISQDVRSNKQVRKELDDKLIEIAKTGQDVSQLTLEAETNQTEDDAIEIRARNLQDGSVITEKITEEDLLRLDPNDRLLIEAFESSVLKDFVLWTALFPKKGTSADELINAKIDKQLEFILIRMCSTLEILLSYLEEIDKDLSAQLRPIRFLCDEVLNV